MEKLEALLTHWQAQDVRTVSTGKLRTDPALQPRDACIAPFADRSRLESESERHIARMADCLVDSELEPMLVADVSGVLYVVDGHHRLKAHKRARERQARVRVLSVTWNDAVAASKLVNCGGAKLPLHPEQARECLWQSMAAATQHGMLPLDVSNRQLGRIFGTSKDTAAAMRKHLSKVNPRDFTADALDSGTGWPRWKYVKGNAMRDRFDDVPQDDRERIADERRATKLAVMIAKDGTDAFLRSIALLKHEAIAEAAAELAEAMANQAEWRKQPP